jgi:hypothetical protein
MAGILPVRPGIDLAPTIPAGTGGDQLMRALSIIVLLIVCASACARKPPESPQPAPSAAAPPKSSAPAEPSPPPPSTSKGKAAPQAANPPATKATPAKPTASAPAKPAKPAPAQAATTPSTTARATQANPSLDLTALKEELKSTKAIGLMTKLSLKNQVDDLLDGFRDLYAGKGKATMPQLRQSYDLLMMKVLSLLQDKDKKLASQIVASREVIWGLLADRQKFAALDV